MLQSSSFLLGSHVKLNLYDLNSAHRSLTTVEYWCGCSIRIRAEQFVWGRQSERGSKGAEWNRSTHVVLDKYAASLNASVKVSVWVDDGKHLLHHYQRKRIVCARVCAGGSQCVCVSDLCWDLRASQSDYRQFLWLFTTVATSIYVHTHTHTHSL